MREILSLSSCISNFIFLNNIIDKAASELVRSGRLKSLLPSGLREVFQNLDEKIV